MQELVTPSEPNSVLFEVPLKSFWGDANLSAQEAKAFDHDQALERHGGRVFAGPSFRDLLQQLPDTLYRTSLRRHLIDVRNRLEGYLAHWDF